jgi:hypothetical protein
MIQLVKSISTEFDKLNRRVLKFFRFGNADVQTAIQTAPYGIDANPIKDMVAVYAETSEKGRPVIIGFLNKNQLADKGELRLYSTDSDGEVKFYTWLKKNGTMEIGGNSKNMVRYQELEAGFNQLKEEFNALVTIFNTHTHSGVTTGMGASGTTATPGVSSTASIAGAKIDEIKTL